MMRAILSFGRQRPQNLGLLTNLALDETYLHASAFTILAETAVYPESYRAFYLRSPNFNLCVYQILGLLLYSRSER
jgi:hypothetical protein